VPARTLDDFKAYVARHEGKTRRFLDPHFSQSGPVRLHHRSQADIARYLLNYMGRDRRYTEKVRNCQVWSRHARSNDDSCRLPPLLRVLPAKRCALRDASGRTRPPPCPTILAALSVRMRDSQAFAADFYSFAAGKKNVDVFSKVLQPFYHQRTHLFLYDPDLYDNPASIPAINS
jgi:hypothetical protein